MQIFNYQYGDQMYSVRWSNEGVSPKHPTEVNYFTVRYQPSRQVIATLSLEALPISNNALYLFIQRRIMEGLIGLPPQEFVSGGEQDAEI